MELCRFGFIQILGPWRLAGDPKNKKKPGGVNEVNVGPRCGVPWVRPLKVWSFPRAPTLQTWHPRTPHLSKLGLLVAMGALTDLNLTRRYDN